MKETLIIASLATLAALTGCHSDHDHAGHSHEAGATAQLCPVSGEELGSMGDPVVLQHEGHEVKLCCDSCKPKFLADPKKYLSKMTK